MAAICLYFQVHQPFRLRRYGVFESDTDYFDNLRNASLMELVARRSYMPTNRLMLDLFNRYGHDFRISLSITVTALEQLERWAPQVLESFQAMAETGCVEFLGETSHSSLAFLYSQEEFRQQIKLHRQAIKRLFGQTPKVFRNTNLIFSNAIGNVVRQLHFEAAIMEGWEGVLGSRNLGFPYRLHQSDLKLLLRHYRLSEDIALRFGIKNWSQWPLTAEKYARWLNCMNGQGVYCLLGMDYETFGERQPEETGIFKFLEALPGNVLALGDVFRTPAQCVQEITALNEINVPQFVSWTDDNRDIGPWLGNAMQANAMQELYRLEEAVKARQDQELLSDWRRLTSSDHFFYMNTRHFGEPAGNIFNPYESPYDGYINFMSVLDSITARIRS